MSGVVARKNIRTRICVIKNRVTIVAIQSLESEAKAFTGETAKEEIEVKRENVLKYT